jgi:hypothetical protein
MLAFTLGHDLYSNDKKRILYALGSNLNLYKYVIDRVNIKLLSTFNLGNDSRNINNSLDAQIKESDLIYVNDQLFMFSN